MDGDPVVILSFTAEKAFNRAEQGFLFSALEKFNLGPKFIELVKLLNSDLLVVVSKMAYYQTDFLSTEAAVKVVPLSLLVLDC